MQQLANRDALTGIRNKTAYDGEIARVRESIKEGDTKLGLAMIDLNFLKNSMIPMATTREISLSKSSAGSYA